MDKETIPQVISFASPKKFNDWLSKNHGLQTGIWLKIYKKGSEVKSVTYAEALDEALCFGWIDGQKKSLDEKSWIQKFTPRRSKSLWSARNKEHVARLTKEGRMKPAGVKEVEAAKKDGRWERAYDSGANMQIPADFLKELKKDKKAFEFFETLNKANTYAIGWRLQTAKKPETRERRMKVIIEMMKEGRKLS
ncbi:MAG: YdeI/OmpD-associated family protein [Bacteroidetes bacterium]|nr:YdeI/OmpD-associated family protein [Bacteroidota bacterium]